VTVSFNLNTGYSLGQALDAINKVIAKEKLPASVVSNYQQRQRLRGRSQMKAC